MEEQLIKENNYHKKIIAIDLQREFINPNGRRYQSYCCANFIKQIFIPYIRKKGYKIAEIISDYRLPMIGISEGIAIPGEFGYQSELPNDIKYSNVWIKSNNSPIWVRDNSGLPYQDPKKFDDWLYTTIGHPNNSFEIILIGIALDCCIFCTAQELTWRGYKVKILEEATDVYSGDIKKKLSVLNSEILLRWSSIITWEEYKKGI